MKAVLQYRASAGFRQRIEDTRPAWLDVAIVPEDHEANFAAAMRDADVLLHVLKPVTAAVMAGAPRLRLIQKIGVGVNTIDCVAAQAGGIVVANMPGTNSQAVAEMTLALMLAVLRRVVPLDRALRDGTGWMLPESVTDSFGEIRGRTVGFVGFGEVPRRLAPVLKALGAMVIFANRSAITDAVADQVGLDELLRRADIVSLHVPLAPETAGMMNAAAFDRMKRKAILINTARGGLVDESALLSALESGRLAGAGLDVLAHEPAVAGHPLFSRDDVVLTPHLGWLTAETLDRSLGVAFENCRRLRDGDALLFRIEA
jgi:phosphoglycerate dehydrogenase-like enzyme